MKLLKLLCWGAVIPLSFFAILPTYYNRFGMKSLLLLFIAFILFCVPFFLDIHKKKSDPKERNKLFLQTICWLCMLPLLLLALIPLYFGTANIGTVILFGLSIALFMLPFFMGVQQRKHQWVKKTAIIVYSIAGAFVFVTSGLMLYQAYGRQPDTTEPYTLIVLGARVIGDQPSLLLRKRLNVAAGYLLKNPTATVIVSGGQGADEIFPEGYVMGKYLEEKGIDANRIIVEDQSTNTRENLRFSEPLIPADSAGVVLVTDNFHQYRASVSAKALGMNPVHSLSSFPPPGLIGIYWVRDMCGVPVTYIDEYIINRQR